MNKNLIYRVFTVGAGCFALNFTAQPAEAFVRTSTAQIGSTVQPADATCIVNSFGGVVNNCSWAVQWEAPLVLDISGVGGGSPVTHPTDISVTGDSSTISCRVVGIDQPMTIANYTNGGIYLTNSQANYHSETLSLGAPIVPISGYGLIQCTIGALGRLNGMTWTP